MPSDQTYVPEAVAQMVAELLNRRATWIGAGMDPDAMCHEAADMLTTLAAENATLRASEAAALERVARLENALLDAGAMRDAADRVSQWFCTEARHLEGPRIQGLRMAIVAYDRHMQPNPALTPTTDKEPKT